MLVQSGLSGRVQPIVGQYLAEPSTCGMCTRPPRSTEEVFLNLGVEIEFFGFFYLCTDCATSIAEAISAAPYEKHQRLKAINASLVSINLENENQIAYLKGLLNARVDSSRSGEPSGDGTDGLSLLEDEPKSESVDSIIDDLESDITESGSN